MERFRNELEVSQQAARRAGKIIRRSYAKLEASDVSEKKANDMVTRVDIESQEHIVTLIRERFPHDYIVAEENLSDDVNRGIDAKNNRRWYIDPLDGTTNYIHAYPIFATSIAFEKDGEVVMGVTYDPMRDEMFHATKGEGAFLNDQRISVSSVSERNRTLFATGFPFRARRLLDDYLSCFRFFFNNCRGIRRGGSAAIDLAYVAIGRVDAFWELTLCPWDMAAGVILVREAGGQVTDFFGGDDSLRNGHIVATNSKFHDWMCESIQEVFPKGTDLSA